MATQSVQAYKQTTIKMLNYVKPGNGWTVDSVLTPEDSPYYRMMPGTLRGDIRIAYADIKPEGFNENPIRKILLIICRNEGRVHMVDAPQGFHAGLQAQDGAVMVGGGINNNNNNALPMGFQDRPLQDQMMVLYSQNAVLGRELS
jgi:hypothetical protein